MKDPEIEKLKEENIILNDPLFIAFRGSITHGTYKSESLADVDLLSVYFAGIRHYLGFVKDKYIGGDDRDLGEYDRVFWSVNLSNVVHFDQKVLLDQSSCGVKKENKEDLKVRKDPFTTADLCSSCARCSDIVKVV